MAQDKLIDGKYEYFAFISYKEEDAEWAKWLQRKLEHYKLPTAIRKEKPELPERISPIYEYKSEAGGGRLKEVIWKGLTSSKYLIVICTPRAGGDKSKWLNNGIHHFIGSGQEEKIIPFIVEGKPNAENPDDECFPTALQELKGERELRGININEMGRDAAAVKVVSRMFDVKFDTLWQRYRRDKKRKYIEIIVGVLLAICFVFCGALWIIKKEKQVSIEKKEKQRRIAEIIESEAEKLIEEGDSYHARVLLANYISSVDDSLYLYIVDKALRKAYCTNSAILRGHNGVVRCIAISQDGQYIASGSWRDNKIIVWNAYTGELLHQLKCDDQVGSISFSPNGNQIAFACYPNDKIIRIWNYEKGKIVNTLKGHNDAIQSVSYSPDGKQIVSSSSKQIILWNVSSGRIAGSIPGSNNPNFHYSSAEFSPDGKYIVTSSSDNTVRIWDAANYKEIKVFNGHTNFVFSASYSHDGKRIVSASSDNTIRIWDAVTGKTVRTLLGHRSSVTSARFSKSDKCIVSASLDSTVRVWDASSGKLIRTFKGHADMVRSTFFAPNDNCIFSSSDDGTVRIWDLQSKPPKKLTGHTSTVEWLSYDDKGSFLFSSAPYGPLRIWDTNTFQRNKSINNTSRLFRNKRLIRNQDIQFFKMLEATNTSIESRILYDIKKEWITIDNEWSVVDMSISPNGKYLLSPGKTIEVWNLSKLEIIQNLKLPTDNNISLFSFSWRNDSKGYAVVDDKGNIYVCNLSDKSIKMILLGDDGISSTIFSVLFSSNDKYIAVAKDKEIKLCDSETGNLLHTMTGHTGEIRTISFSPDNNYLISGSDDMSIRIWNVRTGMEIDKIIEPWRIQYVAFSPDNRHFASAANDTIKIRELLPLKTIIIETLSRFGKCKLSKEERQKYGLD